ncbi:hypothetical protein HLB09_17045 [Pseudokineococcus marinus]|uniref:ATP/GTP-binding protein n=1 Tax=Pseudokineococcus marinus TaxID=351215 RepID=A0A849BTH1_9ACTN|nr:hypothetical protein [Pseudokineococcus marinus]
MVVAGAATAAVAAQNLSTESGIASRTVAQWVHRIRTGGGLRRVEDHPDGEWVVQVVTGGGAERSYRCPGCDQLVPGSSPHVVAWPADGLLGAEAALADRRHWHRPCWDRRAVRRPR